MVLVNLNTCLEGPLLSGQYLNSARKIPINLWVNGKHKTISTDKIATNKN